MNKKKKSPKTNTVKPEFPKPNLPNFPNNNKPNGNFHPSGRFQSINRSRR